MTKNTPSVQKNALAMIANNEEQIRELLDNSLIVYFREYRYQPNDLLEQVKKIREGEEPSIPNLAVSMYRFGALYELFRPDDSRSHQPYHGTVIVMDGIFETLSKVFGPDLNQSFSRYGSNIVNRIYSKQPLDRTEVDWEALERDIEYVSLMIDETIIKYSLKHFYYFVYENRFFFEKVVEKFLEQHSEGIRLAKDVEETIVINHDSVTVITNLGDITFRNDAWFSIELRKLEPVE